VNGERRIVNLNGDWTFPIFLGELKKGELWSSERSRFGTAKAQARKQKSDAVIQSWLTPAATEGKSVVIGRCYGRRKSVRRAPECATCPE